MSNVDRVFTVRETSIGRPDALRTYLALTWYPLLAMFRNVGTLLLGFAFPVAFISVFGLIGGGGDSGPRLGVVGSPSGQVYESLRALPGVTLVNGEPADLERQLRLGKVEGLIRIEGDHVTLTVNSASPQSRLAPLWLQAAVDKLNLRLAGVTAPPVTLEVVQTAGRVERFIDFALPGQIGFAVLATAVFGSVFGILYLKQSLVLKRMFATPVRGITILLGQGTARLLMSLVQTATIIGVGVALFGFHLANGLATLLLMLLLAIFGLVVFLGFGLFIVGRSSNQEAAGPITNLFTLPQFLLSGTFFSTEVFPTWLRPIADNLPLSHLNAAMREVAIEGADLTAVAPHLVALALWGGVAYLLAVRTFRWF